MKVVWLASWRKVAFKGHPHWLNWAMKRTKVQALFIVSILIFYPFIKLKRAFSVSYFFSSELYLSSSSYTDTVNYEVCCDKICAWQEQKLKAQRQQIWSYTSEKSIQVSFSYTKSILTIFGKESVNLFPSASIYKQQIFCLSLSTNTLNPSTQIANKVQEYAANQVDL